MLRRLGSCAAALFFLVACGPGVVTALTGDLEVGNVAEWGMPQNGLPDSTSIVASTSLTSRSGVPIRLHSIEIHEGERLSLKGFRVLEDEATRFTGAWCERDWPPKAIQTLPVENFVLEPGRRVYVVVGSGTSEIGRIRSALVTYSVAGAKRAQTIPFEVNFFPDPDPRPCPTGTPLG